MKATCFNCRAELPFNPGSIVGRGDTCDNCRSDVRVCLNCRHYDPNAYNECGEPMAERVVDKNRANFCDYFSLSAGSGAAAADNSKADALRKLDDLFKK